MKRALACALTLVAVILIESNSTTVQAQTLLEKLIGGSAQDYFGSSVAGIGDISNPPDGRDELLIGAPNDNTNGSASVYSYDGFGWQQLKFHTIGVGNNEQFGSVVASAGDVNGDGWPDYMVAAPYRSRGDVGSGGVWVYSGADYQLLDSIYPAGSGAYYFGRSMACAGDIDGDGMDDVIIGYRYGALVYSVANTTTITQWAPGYPDFGASVDGGRDINNDGVSDLVVGAPGISANDFGRVVVYDGSSLVPYYLFNGETPADLFGSTASIIGDADGDSHADVVVGAYRYSGHSNSQGRAYLFSGGSGAVLRTMDGEAYGDIYGNVVGRASDVNGDGFSDFFVAAPSNDTGGSNAGRVYVYSGFNVALLYVFDGTPDNQLLGAVDPAGDVNADAIPDLVVGFSREDTMNGTNSGAAHVYSSCPIPPGVYCTAKVNSQGCTPYIHWGGMPSASSGSPFRIKASDVLNNKNGILFYGFAPNNLPFQDGFLCVGTPIKRTPVQTSNGNPPPTDCSGTFDYDFNALIQSGADPNLLPCAIVYAEYWYRDPQSPSTTGLTDAVHFGIEP